MVRAHDSGARSGSRRVHARSRLHRGRTPAIGHHGRAGVRCPFPGRVRCSTGSSEHESRAPDYQVGARTETGWFRRGRGPQPVAVGAGTDHNMLWIGWRARIRTWNPLIQSQAEALRRTPFERADRTVESSRTTRIQRLGGTGSGTGRSDSARWNGPVTVSGGRGGCGSGVGCCYRYGRPSTGHVAAATSSRGSPNGRLTM
jgi:hypothetical protein